YLAGTLSTNGPETSGGRHCGAHGVIPVGERPHRPDDVGAPYLLEDVGRGARCRGGALGLALVRRGEDHDVGLGPTRTQSVGDRYAVAVGQPEVDDGDVARHVLDHRRGFRNRAGLTADLDVA